jgi:hypothetical protein
LIKKLNGVSTYIDALTHLDQTIELIGVKLKTSEYENLLSLSKLWANRIYGSTQQTRLYEMVFYQWGLLWMEMINKLTLNHN